MDVRKTIYTVPALDFLRYDFERPYVPFPDVFAPHSLFVQERH